MPGDSEALFDWLALIDLLDYYQLFEIRRDATHDEIRLAFHAFADSFHPDVHRHRSARERDAVERIFKRGTEAYGVLSDPELRAQYDADLAGASATAREAPRIKSGATTGKRRVASVEEGGRLEDQVAFAAKAFARRAEELFQKGDFKQAKIQLVMAQHKDPGNLALAAFDKTISLKAKQKA